MQNRSLKALTTKIIGRLSTYTGTPRFFHNQELKKKKKELVDGCIETLRGHLLQLNGVDEDSDVDMQQARTYLHKLKEPLLNLQDLEAFEEQQKNIRHVSFQQNRDLKQTFWQAFFNSTMRQSTVRKLTENCLEDIKVFAADNNVVEPIDLNPDTMMAHGEGQRPGMPLRY